MHIVRILIYDFYFDGDLVPDFDAWARALEEKIESWIVEGWGGRILYESGGKSVMQGLSSG